MTYVIFHLSDLLNKNSPTTRLENNKIQHYAHLLVAHLILVSVESENSLEELGDLNQLIMLFWNWSIYS
jgi:hypothetical protein